MVIEVLIEIPTGTKVDHLVEIGTQDLVDHLDIGIIGRIEIEIEIGTETEIIEEIEVYQMMVMKAQDPEVVQELGITPI